MTIGPQVRLAIAPNAQGDATLCGRCGNASAPVIEASLAPFILVSYVFVDPFLRDQDLYVYRDWMMDSGAYSAWNSGEPISLWAYIKFCHQQLRTDKRLAEIIALDVINDGKTERAVTAKQSLANALKMRDSGLEVVPVFHFGEDYAILHEYCQAFHKVGISCRFGEPEAQSHRFYEQCFAREWPKKFHSFGWISEDVLRRYPIHSGDSTSWRLGPCAMGNWKRFGKMSVRGSDIDLRSQVRYFLELEKKAEIQWRKEMLTLDALPKAAAHAVKSDEELKDWSVKAIEGMSDKWADYWSKRKTEFAGDKNKWNLENLKA